MRSLPPEQQAAFDSARYLKDKVLSFRATYRPQVDPALAAWSSFDWADPRMADAYDNWAKAHYSVPSSGRGLFALQKGAKVAQFGDQMHMAMAQIAEEIYANPELYPSPNAALADWLRGLADRGRDPSEFGHFFTYSKAGQQQLRDFRAPNRVFHASAFHCFAEIGFL